MGNNVLSNNLLISEPPLQVLPSLAVKVGLNEAIILQQFHYWLQRSNNVHDGHTWIYNSFTEWNKQFPFWSLNTLKRTIYKLEKDGYIITGNFNKSSFDKTKWYRINYHKLDSGQSHQKDTTIVPKRDDQIVSKWDDQSAKFGTDNTNRLPENTHKTTTTKNSRRSEISKSKSKNNTEDDIQHLIDDYEANISPNVTRYLIEDIQQEYEDWKKTDSEHAKDIILLAYKTAVENGVHKWNYVRSILNNWYQGNLTTLVKIKAQQAIKAKQSSHSEPHVLSNKDKLKNKNKVLEAIKEQQKREAQAFNRLGEIDE